MKSNLKLGLLLKEIRNIPSDLREKYNKDLAALAQVEPQKTLTILSWILLAKRPVTIWEIYQVLAVQIDGLQVFVENDLFPEPLDGDWIDENISRFCGDEIVTQDDHMQDQDIWLGLTTLSPLHPSVSDHLLPLLVPENTIKSRQRLFPDVAIESSTHLHIAKICFAWLINNDLESELTVERPSSSAPRLKDYAFNFWHVHLEDAPDRDDFPLELLLDFFRQDNDQFVDWATHFEKSILGASEVTIASPLYYAVVLGLEAVINIIIRDDPRQANFVGGFYGSALTAALIHKRPAYFHQLLQSGADPDLKTTSKCVFLVAVRLRAVPFLELLLQYQANAKIEDNEKANAFHVLATHKHESDSEDSAIFKMLLEQGLDINAKNYQGDTPLMIASARGRAELVKIMLSCRNLDLNATNHANHSAIYQAVRKDQAVIVEILLKAGAESVAHLRNGFTPFSVACSNGNMDIATMLIKKVVLSGHINAGADFNSTPIFLAAYGGYTDIVKLLLDHGAEYTCRRVSGFSPLHAACSNGHLNVVELFLKSSTVNVNQKVPDTVAIEMAPENNYTKSDDRGSTPLILALKRGHENVAKVLLKVRMIDILAMDVKGETALHHAAACGFADIVKDLISRILPEDLPKHNKRNPLYHAIRNGHRDVIRTLFENHFDMFVSERNKSQVIKSLVRNGRDDILELLMARWENSFNILWDHPSTNWLFSKASRSRNHKRTLSFLLRVYTSRSPDNQPDSADWTPLSYASFYDEQQVAIDPLIQLQSRSGIANINHYNGGEYTVLHLAITKGHIKLVELLLVHGADPTLLNKISSETCLHDAIYSGEIKLVEILLAHLRAMDRLDMLNLADSNGYTPVHQAVEDNFPDILNLLLEWGADITCNTIRGTPIYLAAHSGARKIVTILLTHLKSTNNLGHIKEESMISGFRVTPLVGAISKGYLDVAHELIKHGALVSNTSHRQEKLPTIHHAVYFGCWQIVELICTEDPSNLSLKDDYGRTPLMYASYDGNVRMVRLLLNQPHEATLIIDPNGRTAFHYAAAAGRLRIVKLLYQYNPSLLNMSDLHGATALSLAVRRQRKEVVKFLIEIPDIDYDLMDIFGKDVMSWLATIGMNETDTYTTKHDQLALVFGKLAQVSTDYTESWCDVCMLFFDANNRRWHCKLCHGGDFDICQECRDRGAYCLNREHELVMLAEQDWISDVSDD